MPSPPMPPRRGKQRQPRPVIMLALLLLLAMVFAFLHSGRVYGAQDEQKQKARLQMVDAISREVKETGALLGRKNLGGRVLQAMGKVPRHSFVPEKLQDFAYENRPLPIGHGQTISQPYIVAVMTDLLDLKKSDRVLEIGTGSGYQAAVLAELVQRVFTIEIIKPLALRAAEVFKDLGYGNIVAKSGDGYYGWPQEAPFDAIIVTAAASHIPPPLVRQLKEGGSMIIPVGSNFMVQQLVLIRKNAKGAISTRQILPVRFVPLTGGH